MTKWQILSKIFKNNHFSLIVGIIFLIQLNWIVIEGKLLRLRDDINMP